MSIDYASKAASAHRMIVKAGAPVTFTRVAATYDTGTSEATGVASATEGYAFRDQYSTRDIDGTVIAFSDVKLIVSPFAANCQPIRQPKNGDKATFAGVTYTVQNVRPYDFAGVPVCFELQARAGA